VCQVFVLLTSGASFDIVSNPCFGAWPEVFLVDAPDRFVSARVTIDGALMPDVHQFTFQSLVRWYDEPTVFDVPPERLVWVIDAFDWVDACPIFHQ
jgi:hypothetical protein